MGKRYRAASGLTDRDRFWLRVEPSEGCWTWLGATSPNGYGIVQRGGRVHMAHRVAWEYARGAIPSGKVVCHACDNPPCVNPAHLFVGTQADNIADMDRKGRRRSNPPKGPNAKRAVLSEAEAVEIRRRYAEGERQLELAAAFGVSKGTIYNVLRGKHWAASGLGGTDRGPRPIDWRLVSKRREAGASWAAVAQEIGMSKTQLIERWARETGRLT